MSIFNEMELFFKLLLLLQLIMRVKLFAKGVGATSSFDRPVVYGSLLLIAPFGHILISIVCIIDGIIIAVVDIAAYICSWIEPKKRLQSEIRETTSS